mmetsp:Transcript_7259/g.13426  ORF Transcript_7259/g.13426 Transcript_7259/m.13426 type:complete len:201 (-) Transcript_7259:827-1429(-)
MSLKLSLVHEPLPERLCNQCVVPVPYAKLQYQQFPRGTHLGAKGAVDRRRRFHSARRMRLRALPAASIRIGALLDRLLPQQCRRSGSLPLVLPVFARTIPVPRAGRRVPRLWSVHGHRYSRRDRRQRSCSTSFCDAGVEASPGADQDLRPFYWHRPCFAPGRKVQGSGVGLGDAILECEDTLQRSRRAVVPFCGRMVSKR